MRIITDKDHTIQGNFGASNLGMTEAPVTLAESVAGILSHIDGATRSEKSGKFWNFAKTSGNFWDINESVLPW
jgi:norsolorinic acid ketoreductase